MLKMKVLKGCLRYLKKVVIKEFRNKSIVYKPRFYPLILFGKLLQTKHQISLI